MKTAKVPVYYPVDHKANFTGYTTHTADADAIKPWPLGQRVAILIGLSIAGWAIVLAPFFLIG